MPTAEELGKELKLWLEDGHHEYIRFLMNAYYITGAQSALIARLLVAFIKHSPNKAALVKYEGETNVKATLKIAHLETGCPDYEKVEEEENLTILDKDEQSNISWGKQIGVVNFQIESILIELNKNNVIKKAEIDNDVGERIKILKAYKTDKYLSKHNIYRYALSEAKVFVWEEARQEIASLIFKILDDDWEHAEEFVKAAIDNNEDFFKKSSNVELKRQFTAYDELPGLLTDGDGLNYQEAVRAYYAIKDAWDNACDFHELKTFMESSEKISNVTPKVKKKYQKICKYFTEQYIGDYSQDIINKIVQLAQTKEKTTGDIGINFAQITIEDVKKYLGIKKEQNNDE